MKKYKIYIAVFIFLWLFTFFVALYRIDRDVRQIKKLEKENQRLKVAIHEYNWQIDQYFYMFERYCGGMNN